MLANRTIVSNDEQAAPILGIAKSLQSQPNATFALLCPDEKRVPLPEPLVQVLLLAAQAMTRKSGITMMVRSGWRPRKLPSLWATPARLLLTSSTKAATCLEAWHSSPN